MTLFIQIVGAKQAGNQWHIRTLTLLDSVEYNGDISSDALIEALRTAEPILPDDLVIDDELSAADIYIVRTSDGQPIYSITLKRDPELVAS